MTQFTKNDTLILERQRVYDGFFTVDKIRLQHKLFSGGWSPPFTRELMDRGHAVAILPYDPKRKQFVFIEQFRIGALSEQTSSEQFSPWLLETVAGVIDPGETIKAVALREAKEEADLYIDKLIPLLDYLSSPGGTTERIYLFLGLVDSTHAGGIHGLAHENEDIKVICIDEQETKRMLRHGEIQNAATLIALQQFFLYKDEWLQQESV